MEKSENIKIAFIVGSFPEVSETFIIDQTCDLLDRGVEIDIYSFNRGRANSNNVSSRYFDHKLDSRTTYLNSADSKMIRFLMAPLIFIKLLVIKPNFIFEILKEAQKGKSLRYFKILLWNTNKFKNKKYDLYHCHFGNVALDFLIIRKILNIKERFITSLYGYDISKRIKEKGSGIYKELIKESEKFIVMSENMKQRVVEYGFPIEKLLIHPISIDVGQYNFRKREGFVGDVIQMISVGRFVGKKGFDDLIKAIAIVKEKAKRKFKCVIVGDGPMHKEIHSLADSLKVNDVLEFKGLMSIDKVLELFNSMDFIVQPSKTAKDGDME